MKLTVTFKPQSVSVSAKATKVEVGVREQIARDLVQIDPYEGEYSVTPTGEQQTLATNGKRMTDDMTIEAIPDDYIGSAVPRKDSSDLTASGATVTAPNGYYSEDATKSVVAATWHSASQIAKSPSISVDGNGLITATVSGSANITPVKTSGWAESSHPYPMTVTGSKTKQLPTEAGKTVTPTESQQTAVASEKFTTGNIIVDAIPADYVGSAVERRTSEDLLVTGSTVNVPSGYYAENEGKAIPDATHASPSSLTVNPTLEVDYETGTITASNSASATISPVHDDGYATLAFTHTVNVGGNTATQLITIGETIYTPSGSAQIIPSGRFLTGNQTISAIAPPWYDMSGDMAWLGKGAELFKPNFYLKEFTLYDTAFNGWTPSTTAKDILATATAGTFSADLENYEYYIVWKCGVDPVYTGTPTLKAHNLLTRAFEVQQIYKRPSSWANITADNFNGNVCSTMITQNLLRYYGTTTGTTTYSWNVSYGFYYTLTAATFSSSTSDTPTVTVKTPKLSARCSTTYMSTANAGRVDQLNSKCWISCDIYRVKRDGILRGVHNEQVDFINEEHTFAPISFTIGETTYQADLGSTWQGWVDGAYNTAGASVSDNTIIIGTKTVQYSSTNVTPSDAIVKSRAYTLSE